MGGSIGVDLGPSRKGDFSIGLDPRDKDRLIIRKHFPVGCLLLSVAIVCVGLSLSLSAWYKPGYDSAALIFGVLCAFLGTTTLFGRYWLVIDRKQNLIEESFGIIFPCFRLQSIFEGKPNIAQKLQTDGNHTLCTITLECRPENIEIAKTGVWETGVYVAEILAHFLETDIHDKDTGEIRYFRDIDISLGERLTRSYYRAIRKNRTKSLGIGGGDTDPEKFDCIRTITFHVTEETGETCAIHVPKPRRHGYAVISPFILIFWTFPVWLTGGGLPFALLPLLIMLGAWIKVAYGYSADIELTPMELKVLNYGLILKNRVKIPLEELEEIVVISIEGGGPRDVISYLFEGVVVARSDKTSVRFGYGLNLADLDKLRIVLLGKIKAAHKSRLNHTSCDSLPPASAPQGTKSFQIPVFFDWLYPVSGAILGAFLSPFLKGIFTVSVALPFLEHIVTAGSVIGFLLGVGLSDNFVRRGNRISPQWVVFFICLITGFILFFFYPENSFIQPFATFNEGEMLANPEIWKLSKFTLGWYPFAFLCLLSFLAVSSGLLGLITRNNRKP